MCTAIFHPEESDLPDISDPKFLAQCRKASLTVKTVGNLTFSMPLLTKDANDKAQTTGSTKVKIEKRRSRVRVNEPTSERLIQSIQCSDLICIDFTLQKFLPMILSQNLLLIFWTMMHQFIHPFFT